LGRSIRPESDTRSPWLLNRRLSRRRLIAHARILVATGGLVQIAGCSPISFQPSTPVPDIEAVETPASVPEQPEPTPETTPVESPEPTPTPVATPIPEPVPQVLRLAGTFFDIESHDPTELPDCLANAMTSAGLVRLNDAFTIEPDWAIAWEPLADREGWRFRLRLNDDGIGDSSITAHDFAASWLHLLESDESPSGRALLADVENAAAFLREEVPASDVGIVAVDDWTLDVALTHRRETFPMVVSSPLLQLRSPVPESNSGDSSCGWSGPFAVSVFDDTLATLFHRDEYWNPEPPSMERIEFLAYTSGLALTEFGQGELDMIRLSGSDAIRIREDSTQPGTVIAAMPERLIGLVPDPDVPPFDDPAVRRILSLSIDRRRLELIVEGRVIPAARMFPIGMFPMLDDAAAGIVTRFSVDDAYEELGGSMYPNPSDWPVFGIDVPALDSTLDRIARDVAVQLRENLGIQVPIRVHDPEEYREGLLERRYALSWLDWSYPYADPASVYAELFPGWRSGSVRVPWQHAEYDELLLAADSMENPEARANAWAGCEGLVQEHGAIIPLVHPVEYFQVQSWVEGLPLDGRGRFVAGRSIGLDFSRRLSISERPD
jgi:ABC-type transport system substrate-binding protein